MRGSIGFKGFDAVWLELRGIDTESRYEVSWALELRRGKRDGIERSAFFSFGQVTMNNHGSFGVRRLVAAMARRQNESGDKSPHSISRTRYLSVFRAHPAAETESHF